MTNEERMFRAHWHIVCHESELKEEGSWVVLNWYPGQQVAATRQQGELVVFDNRCPHRGKLIFPCAAHRACSTGVGPAQCSYHGWRYSSRNSSGLRRIPFAWFGSFLYACEAPEFFGSPAVMLRASPHEDIAVDVVLVAEMAFWQNCDWRVAVENTLEADHIATVHGCTALAAAELGSIGCELFSSGASLEMFEARNPRTLALLDFMQSTFNMDFATEYDYVHGHIFPFTAISSTRGYTYSLQQYFPAADGGALFASRLYSRPADSDVSAYLEAVKLGSQQVFMEDAEICEGVPVQQGTDRLRKTETRIKHFRETLSQWGVV